jgi:Universal stress protein family
LTQINITGSGYSNTQQTTASGLVSPNGVGEGGEMAKKILAAIDGSEHAWKAFDLAADVAKQSGAQLIVLHLVPFEPMSDAMRAFAEAEHMPVEEEKDATTSPGPWATA